MAVVSCKARWEWRASIGARPPTPPAPEGRNDVASGAKPLVTSRYQAKLRRSDIPRLHVAPLGLRHEIVSIPAVGTAAKSGGPTSQNYGAASTANAQTLRSLRRGLLQPRQNPPSP